MSFGSPLLLLTLLVVPLLLIWLAAIRRRGTRNAVAYTNVDLLAALVPTGGQPAMGERVPEQVRVRVANAGRFGAVRDHLIDAARGEGPFARQPELRPVCVPVRDPPTS